jgi:hypothetical protein
VVRGPIAANTQSLVYKLFALKFEGFFRKDGTYELISPGKKNSDELPCHLIGKKRIALEPIKAPSMEKEIPLAAIRQTSFLLVMKLTRAKLVRMVLANLFVPIAAWEGALRIKALA